ncbi:hypothetical protein ACIRSU_05245 [Streptomyces sp. NPDC101160]|uniref:hypothetical protein n=1 Tax=Streptomyces sp. NPDC101160 TaxID=3366118 RepID=UPI0037F8F7DC
MWPGQQPPGGEQNPQDQSQNPYAQPAPQPGYGYPNQQPGAQPGPYQQPGQPGPGQPGGYGQPNPYQQPTQQGGYGQPNPYQQPTVPQYAMPGPVQPGGGDGSGGKKKQTTVVAIVAAVAVLAAAGVAGWLVLGKDDDKKNQADDPKPSQSTISAPTTSASPSLDNPRDEASHQPTIPGWKVVYNPKYGTLFDVPPEWELSKPGTINFFEDEKKGDGSPVVTMSAPAHFKTNWCSYDTNKDGSPETWGLSTAGTKGGQGAKDTAEAAYNEAGNWVWAGYAQHMPKGTIKITKAVPFTTASGLQGSMATAVAPNIKKRNKCESDGKSVAFSFKNAKGDFSSFVLYAAKGVKEEVPDETIKKIVSTVRLAPEAPSPQS